MKSINEMTPDEIRIEIAERLGWSGKEVLGECFIFRDPKGHTKPDYPNWPTDIAAAWGLVEEIEKRGDGYLMSDIHYGDGRVRQELLIYSPVGGQAITVDRAESDTAPLAICKCWLQWKRGQNETNE